MKDSIINKINKAVYNDQVNNNDLVQIIEHCAGFLNLQTIADYARNNNISYNGAKKFRQVKQICGIKFIIDNS